MDICYTRDEMVSIEDLEKNLEFYMDKLQNSLQEKILIIDNNTPETVLISAKEYNRLKEAEELYNMMQKDEKERI